MEKQERLIKIIYSAVDEVNEQLSKEQRLKKSLDIALFNASGIPDSLALVNLIVAIEEKIQEEFNINITLSEELFSNESLPENLGSLLNKLSHILKVGEVGQYE
jgi:acyl carrier protein